MITSRILLCNFLFVGQKFCTMFHFPRLKNIPRKFNMFSSSDLITRTWQYCAKENKTNLSEYARTRDIS